MRAWERRRRIPEHSGEHVAPDEGRDRQPKREPELVPEHRDAVAGVLVMARASARATTVMMMALMTELR